MIALKCPQCQTSLPGRWPADVEVGLRGEKYVELECKRCKAIVYVTVTK